MNPRTLFSLSLLGAALVAQAPSPSPALARNMQDGEGPRPVPIATAADLFGPSGVVHDRLSDTEWAAAAAWKAGFAPDGATFVPFLGSDAERNWPVTFGTRRAVVAGVDLPLQQDAVAVRDGLRVTYHRGAMQERYDLRKEGMEQSFWFADLPLRGELVVEVAVQTDLECQPDGAGFRFQGPRGGVSYGTAVAIDATGRRLDLQTGWRQGALLLTVPADFVRQAELPLLIDPLVGTVTAFPAVTNRQESAGICHDATLDQYVVCQQHVFSQTDDDVYVRRLDGQMTLLPGTTVIDSTTTSWRRPRIAALEAHDRCLVVAEVSTGNAAPFRVGGRVFVNGVSPSVLAAFDLALNARSPDVGGDPGTSVVANWLVVYEKEFSTTDHDIRARLLAAAGTSSNEIAVDNSLSFEERPRVSRTNGRPGSGAQQWAVVWQRYDGNGLGHLRGSAIGPTGVPAGSFPLSATGSLVDYQWAVSSPLDQNLGSTFLLVESRWNTAAFRQEVLATAFSPSGSLYGAQTLLHQGPETCRNPAVDSDGCRFAVAYQREFGTSPIQNHDIHALTVGLAGAQLLVQDQAMLSSQGTEDDRQPSVIGRRNAPFSARFGVAWARSVWQGGSWVEAVRYDAMAGQGGWSTRPTGCGGLSIQGLGDGNLGSTVTYDLLGTQGLAGFVAGSPVSVPVAPCPGCIQGANGNTFLATQLILQIPCQPALVGATVAFQGWEFSTGPCLGQIRLSHTIDLQLR